MQGTQVWPLVWDCASEHLGGCATTSKPTNFYWSLGASNLLPQEEKPLQWEAHAIQLERSPCSLQLEKAQVRQCGPSTDKNNTEINLQKKFLLWWLWWHKTVNVVNTTELCTLKMAKMVRFLLRIFCFPSGSEVKNPPAMREPQETWVKALCWEDPVEEEMATHSRFLLCIFYHTQKFLLHFHNTAGQRFRKVKVTFKSFCAFISVILWFTIRNIYLVFILISGTQLLKLLKCPDKSNTGFIVITSSFRSLLNFC